MLILIVLNTQGKIMKEHDALTLKFTEIELNKLIENLNQYLFNDAEQSMPDEEILLKLLSIKNKISFVLNNVKDKK